MAKKKIKHNAINVLKTRKSVHVHGHEFKIKLVKKMSGGAAECDWGNSKLSFAPSCLKTELRALWYLLHEVRHASQEIGGLKQVLDEDALEYDAEQFASLVIELKNQGII